MKPENDTFASALRDLGAWLAALALYLGLGVLYLSWLTP